MISNVTDVVLMPKSQSKAQSVKSFSFAAMVHRPVVTISIINDRLAAPGPTGSTGVRLSDGKNDRLHPVVKLRRSFYEIRNIEGIRNVRVHSGDAKIKPLMMRTNLIQVRRQKKFVFYRRNLYRATEISALKSRFELKKKSRRWNRRKLSGKFFPIFQNSRNFFRFFKKFTFAINCKIE